MKKKWTSTLSVILAMAGTISTVAQTAPPNPNPPPPGLPIDGFLGLAGLLAITYGVYKKYNNPKN
jgi:H+/gluconate symporter-like permease